MTTRTNHSRQQHVVSGQTLSLHGDPPRFWNAGAMAAAQIPAQPPADRWLEEHTVVYGCLAPPNRGMTWRALVDARGQQLPDRTPAAQAQAGQPTKARKLDDAAQPPTTAWVLHALRADEGALAHVIALPAADDFASPDEAFAALRASAPVPWHAAGVATRPGGPYAVELLADEGRNPLANTVVILRALPAEPAQRQRGGQQPGPGTQVFALVSDAQGNVRANLTQRLMHGGQPYAGGAPATGDTQQWSWQRFSPPGGVRIAPGRTYKSIRLTAAQRTTMTWTQLAGLLDPQVDQRHTVQPDAADREHHRLLAVPVQEAARLPIYPDGELPNGPDGQPRWPRVNRSRELVRTLAAATARAEQALAGQGRVSAAHIVLDYYSTSGWRRANGEFVRASPQELPHLSLNPPEEFFERSLEALRSEVESADVASHHASASVESAAGHLKDHLQESETIAQLADFVVAGGIAHGQWMQHFIADVCHHLSWHRESLPFRRQVLAALTGEAPEGDAFHPLYSALLQSGQGAEGGGAGHAASSGSPPGGAGGGVMRIEAGEEAEASSTGEDLEKVHRWLELIAGAAKTAAEKIHARVEGTRALATEWQQWANRHLHTEFVTLLHSISPARCEDLIGVGELSFLEEARAYARTRPESALRTTVEHGLDEWATWQQDMSHARSLNLRAERLSHLQGATVTLREAIEKVNGALAALTAANALVSFITAFRSSRRAEAAGSFAGALKDVLPVVNEMRLHHISRSLEQSGVYGEEAFELTERADALTAVGKTFAKMNLVLNIVVAGFDLWKMHHLFDEQGDSDAYETSRLEAIGAALTVVGLFLPPPLNAACAGLGQAISALNIVRSFLWNEYVDEELIRMEKLKARCARSTELATHPHLYLSRIEIDERRVTAQAPSRITPALWAKARLSGRPFAMVVHKYEGPAQDPGQAVPWVPLAPRSRLPAAWSFGDSLQPIAYGELFRALAFTPRFEAEEGALSFQLPEDLVAVPQWAWETSEPIGLQRMAARARFETLRSAAQNTRPLPVIVQLFWVEGNDDAQAAREIWSFHFGGSSGSEQLLAGVSEPYDAELDANGAVTRLRRRQGRGGEAQPG